MMIRAVPIPEDLSGIRLRELDAMECRVGGFTEADAIRYSMQEDKESWMVTADDEPVAFWGYGVQGFLQPVANGWLLTTPAIDALGLEYRLARVSKRIVDYILTQAHNLVVQTHVEHGPACKWLRWLGFEELKPLPNGLLLMVKRRG